MKTLFMPILMLSIVGIMVSIGCFACTDENDNNEANNDDNTSTTYGTPDYVSPECLENAAAPQLLSVALIVNDQETEMPATVLTTDNVAIAMEYSDEDCNIAPNGKIWISSDPEDLDLIGFDDVNDHLYYIGEIGCSSAEEGEPYYLEINPMDYLMPEGVERNYPWEIWFCDSCGFDSKPYDYFITLDFTVVEE